jgi:hypothetical protein
MQGLRDWKICNAGCPGLDFETGDSKSIEHR